MITIDRITNIEDLKYAEAYEQVENYNAGEEASINYFKQIYDENNYSGVWNDDMVHFYGGKKFRTYDEENNITIETTIYESYIDPGSTDYFFFYYNIEL